MCIGRWLAACLVSSPWPVADPSFENQRCLSSHCQLFLEMEVGAKSPRGGKTLLQEKRGQGREVNWGLRGGNPTTYPLSERDTIKSPPSEQALGHVFASSSGFSFSTREWDLMLVGHFIASHHLMLLGLVQGATAVLRCHWGDSKKGRLRKRLWWRGG